MRITSIHVNDTIGHPFFKKAFTPKAPSSVAIEFGQNDSKKTLAPAPSQKVGMKTLLAVSAFSGLSGFLGGICGGVYNAPKQQQQVQVIHVTQEAPHTDVKTNTVLSSGAPPGRYYRVQSPAQTGDEPENALPQAPPILGADEANNKRKETHQKQLEEQEQVQKEQIQKEYDEALKQTLLFNTQLDPNAFSPKALKLRQEIQGKLQSHAFEKTALDRTARRDELYENLATYVQPATVQLVAEFKTSIYRFFQPHPFMPPQLNEGIPNPQSGSGFFINSKGLLLTNNHVVQLSYRDKDMQQQTRMTDKLHVKLANGQIATAKLVVTDKKLDLALYQLEGEHSDLPYLELATSAKVGTEVMAMGHPINSQWSASFGKISNTQRAMLGSQFIETDTKINPGNSGGPLVNNQGEVVGVNVLIRSTDPGTPGSPIGQAIPFNTLKGFIEAHLQK